MENLYIEDIPVETVRRRFSASARTGQRGHEGKGFPAEVPDIRGGILHVRRDKSIARDFFSLAMDEPYRPIFIGSPYEPLINYSPLIFSINAPGHALYERLLTRQDNWGFLYLGKGSFDFNYAHWRSLLSVIMPDGTASHFHFYNPSVMATIAQACTEEELAALCGPASELFIPLPEGKWKQIHNPGDPHAFIQSRSGKGTALQKKPWWKVRQGHLEPFASIMERVYRENIEVRIWEESPVLAKEVAAQYGDVGAFVNAALADARAKGFVTPEHEFKYIMLCLHYDCNIAPSWWVQQALALAPGNPDLALRSLEYELRSARHGI
jgi:hypothetical protein